MKRRPKDYDRTAYVCYTCREAERKRLTHPGQFHQPGICDCACRPAREAGHYRGSDPR